MDNFDFIISGINRLVEEGIFTAGYPLHPVSCGSYFFFFLLNCHLTKLNDISVLPHKSGFLKPFSPL